MEQKRYVFIKDYKNEKGTIPNGSEITLFRGFIYMNGGMILPAYNKIIMNILRNEDLKNEYLREVKIIQNKI